MFLSSSLQNLTDSDRMLVRIVLIKFVVQKCKPFLAHLNSVSILPCEMAFWN